MRRLAILPILAFAAACADQGVLQPVGALPGDVAAAAVPNPAQGGWEVHFLTSYIGTPQPGESRFAGNNLIGWDVINAFAITGDFEGTWYFMGRYQANLKTGNGTSISHDGLIDITGPGAMVGTFVCGAHGTIEDFTLDWSTIIQYGKQFSCTGTGYFEGKQFKGTFANLGPGSLTYDVTGVIY